MSEVRGCPFIKIWFNGSIRTSFTESYKIKQRIPHRPIRAPIFVYYSWTASYMRQPNYVGFSKLGSDTTIEPNFDEMPASGLWKLVGINKKSEWQWKGGVFIILSYKIGKFRGEEALISFRHSFHKVVDWHADFQRLTTWIWIPSLMNCVNNSFKFFLVIFYQWMVPTDSMHLRCRECPSSISTEAYIWKRPTWKGSGGREIRLKGLKFKNGRNERSFIFAPQSKFKPQNIIHENLGSLRGAF